MSRIRLHESYTSDWNDQIVLSRSKTSNDEFRSLDKASKMSGSCEGGPGILLMAEIRLTQFIGSLSHYILLFTGVYTFQVVQDFFYQQYC